MWATAVCIWEGSRVQNKIVAPRQWTHPLPRLRKTTTHRAYLFCWMCSFCPASLCDISSHFVMLAALRSSSSTETVSKGSNLFLLSSSIWLKRSHLDFYSYGKIDSMYLTMSYIFSPIWYRNKKWKLKSHPRAVFQFVSLQAAAAPSTAVLSVPGGTSTARDSYCSTVGSQSGQNPARYAV